jgi:hypothetical protein
MPSPPAAFGTDTLPIFTRFRWRCPDTCRRARVRRATPAARRRGRRRSRRARPAPARTAPHRAQAGSAGAPLRRPRAGPRRNRPGGAPSGDAASSLRVNASRRPADAAWRPPSVRAHATTAPRAVTASSPSRRSARVGPFPASARTSSGGSSDVASSRTTDGRCACAARRSATSSRTGPSPDDVGTLRTRRCPRPPVSVTTIRSTVDRSPLRSGAVTVTRTGPRTGSRARSAAETTTSGTFTHLLLPPSCGRRPARRPGGTTAAAGATPSRRRRPRGRDRHHCLLDPGVGGPSPPSPEEDERPALARTSCGA